MYAQFSLSFKSKGHFLKFIIISPELNKEYLMNTMLKLFSKLQISVGDQKLHNSLWLLLELGFSEKDLVFFFVFFFFQYSLIFLIMRRLKNTVDINWDKTEFYSFSQQIYNF